MYSDITPFDLQRMFIGEQSLLFVLEVIFRTGFMYTCALVAARFIGKRGMGQLTPFEYIIVITLGSATGDPMFYPNVPLIHGVAVISVIVTLERVLSELTQRNKRVERTLESTPVLLVKDGKVQHGVLNKVDISKDELLMQLRMQGVRFLGEVEYAYFEPSGRVSIIKYEQGHMSGETTLPSSNA